MASKPLKTSVSSEGDANLTSSTKLIEVAAVTDVK